MRVGILSVLVEFNDLTNPRESCLPFKSKVSSTFCAPGGADGCATSHFLMVIAKQPQFRHVYNQCVADRKRVKNLSEQTLGRKIV